MFRCTTPAFSLCLVFFMFNSPAVSQYSRQLIILKDKNGSPYSFNAPSAYLSPKAIERRTRFNIPLDSTDLPVNPVYLDSIKHAGAVTILNVSKWLNQVLIRTTDAAALDKISRMPFVKIAEPLANRPLTPTIRMDKFNELLTDGLQQANTIQTVNTNSINYGNSFAQIHMHEGEFLHDQGYLGEGMTIAVLDDGFNSYLTNPGFDSIRNNNQILGTWDYVDNESSVNEDHPHGSECLSIMAGNFPGYLVGTAPHAKYWLFRTEDVNTEYPVEEQNWAAAIEQADSLGVDLVTSSLGYSTFTDPTFNHAYADMNGHTTIVTRAAELAVKKGMIVTNSAGNEGNHTWKYITAPADGENVLTIGAIDLNKVVAPFSSFGPTSDGRVKPDVTSLGLGTFLIGTSGNIIKGNGTSFSNPNLAGLITCLWQAFPEFSNKEILNAVKKSSNQYSTPDERVGYGIPDFKIAHDLLKNERIRRQAEKVLGNDDIKVFPNPVVDRLTILFKAIRSGSIDVQLIDASGRMLQSRSQDVRGTQISIIQLEGLTIIPHGTYYLRYRSGDQHGTIRLVK